MPIARPHSRGGGLTRAAPHSCDPRRPRDVRSVAAEYAWRSDMGHRKARGLLRQITMSDIDRRHQRPLLVVKY